MRETPQRFAITARFKKVQSVHFSSGRARLSLVRKEKEEKAGDDYLHVYVYNNFNFNTTEVKSPSSTTSFNEPREEMCFYVLKLNMTTVAVTLTPYKE